MSAFVVNRCHVAAICTWYASTLGGNLGDAGKMTKTLLDENIKSFNHRYGENVPECEPFSLHEMVEARLLKPIEVLKAVNCLRYQSCEHPEWEASEAKAFLDLVLGKAVVWLPGYDEAEWELSENVKATV